jgi:2-keto-4-pentenoate hydratase
LLDATVHLNDLDLPAAYAVQNALTQRRLAEGRTQVGHKLGYTSVAMRQQMGIAEANFGPLLDDMMLADGALAVGFLQPRVEPEIAVVLGTDLYATEPSLDQVAAAIREVRACLEIVDSIWQDYRFTLEQNTADGSSAAGVVLGPTIDIDPIRCDGVTVTLFDGETAVAHATGAAASGHPLLGLVWLCTQLARLGRGLRAGDVVITGGLTAALALRPGATVRAAFGNAIDVTVVGGVAATRTEG